MTEKTMSKVECAICGQTSESAFCPYCGMKLQPTEEERKKEEKRQKAIEKKQRGEAKLAELEQEHLAIISPVIEKSLPLENPKRGFMGIHSSKLRPHQISRKRRQLRYQLYVIFVISQVLIIWGFLTNWTYTLVLNNWSFTLFDDLDFITTILIVFVIGIILIVLYINWGMPKARDMPSRYRRR